jgi:tetratricopeptide (TPR) repeat protein
MFGSFKALLSPLRRHPWIAVAAVLLTVAGAAAGLELWARARYRAAEKELHDFHLDEARRHVGYCLRVWPRGPATHLLAARIERWAGDYPKAEQLLNSCQQLQGGPSEATQVEWILMRTQAGELNQNEVGLWKCVEQNHPQSVEILATLARSYMMASRLGPGFRALNQWLERDPTAPQAWYWRGWSYERVGNMDAAMDDFNKSLELDPDRLEVRLRLASLYLDNKKPVEALPHFERLARSHPDNPEVLAGLAQCLVYQGETDKARDLLDRALAKQPDQVRALTLRGQIDCEKERPAEGEVWLRKALALKPRDKDALFQLSTCLKQQPGREREAAEVHARHEAVVADLLQVRALLDGPVLRSPQDPDLLTQVGVLLLRLGEDKHGVDYLRRALHEDERFKPAHEALARYYEDKGDLKGAAEHRRALTQLGDSPARSSPKP